jgi:hypothetical protein
MCKVVSVFIISVAATIASVPAYAAGRGQVTAKPPVSLTIKSNPDKVTFELRAYRPADPALSAVGFREGWYAAEPFGPGDPAYTPGAFRHSGSPKLTDFDKLPGTIAVVVRWKVKAGQELAPDGIGPHIRGVTEVPDRFKASLSKENYKAVATQLEGLGLLVQSKISTGQIEGAYTQRNGVAQFLWFVPADTKSLELILPPHKPITVTTSGSQ